MNILTRSNPFLFLGKVLFGIVVGSLWYTPIVPFLFYITFADTEMKEQMQGDLGEFHSIAYVTRKRANEGISLNLRDKTVLIVKRVSEIGYWIWPPAGVLWGFSDILFPRHRSEKGENSGIA